MKGKAKKKERKKVNKYQYSTWWRIQKKALCGMDPRITQRWESLGRGRKTGYKWSRFFF